MGIEQTLLQYNQFIGGFSIGLVVGGIMTLRYIAPKIYGPIISRLELEAKRGQ